MKIFKEERGAINASLIKLGIFAAIAFVLVGIAANFIPTMMEGWDASRVVESSYTETETNVATSGAGNTSANVSLDHPVLYGSVSSVTSISSNESGDSSANANALYDDYTTLEVAGLAENTTRTLTIAYYWNSIGQYTGFGTVTSMAPTLIILGFVVAVAVVAFLGIRVAKR